jgi:ParB/RepB/Spo0J family partition protein
MYTQTVAADFRSLAVDQLRESPTNPRRSFDQGKLQELAHSIRAQGILVPIIVRPTAPESFEVVAGARRFRAAQMAELFAVPARVVALTDAEALTLQLVENAIREDVHPYEEAMAYRALLETSEPRYDVASLALKTGRSVNHIYGRLRMAELIPDAAEVFQANQITAGHAVLIARLPREQQARALEATLREDWRTKDKHAVSVRELGQWIRQQGLDTLLVRSTAESLIVALNAKDEKLWVYNGDQIRQWSAEHRKRLRRWSEDSKAEHLPSPPFAEKREFATVRYRHRMSTACHQIAEMIAGYACRRRFAGVVYDDSVRDFCPEFSWAVLAARIAEKCDGAGLTYAHRGAEEAPEEDQAGTPAYEKGAIERKSLAKANEVI